MSPNTKREKKKKEEKKKRLTYKKCEPPMRMRFKKTDERKGGDLSGERSKGELG